MAPAAKSPRSRAPPRGRHGAAPAVARRPVTTAEEKLVQEMLELAFHRAAKVATSGDSRVDRQRRLALRKIGRTSGNLLRQLRLATQPFQDEAEIGPFRLGLLEQRLGPGALHRSLARVRRAQERITRFRTEEERRVPRMETRDEIASAVRRYYGRSASLLREVASDLLRIREADRLLRDRPALEGGASVVVIAGYPNVGKSSLLTRLTRARPKVAPYPFTTVAVSVGHAKLGPIGTAEVVDTPGILDRAGRSSGPIEQEAMLAVRSGGPVVLFLLDPTGTCGWPLVDQEALLGRLRERFPEKTFLEVENKSDLSPPPSHRRRISCKSGEGIEALLEELDRALRAVGGGLPPLPPMEEEPWVEGQSPSAASGGSDE